ncbi:DUF1415 domain-containing protein [Marinomonas mediterranea]|jgi:Uncharacterized protein conserved in bacteria|uniref:Uncharacterized protein n=1 Tax=Marinomonas mediterranea (strain ATCC 700492 / JCM 21426 / NBRC 103028 / MMB-1) TaxID=717774 RepID=F2K3G7_MARM1|nr:DUF1415 domain-containing protein [Marinomonas mediterranea]ADZ91309.1 protein of unknown function DUF1415 [Marinomonas mediterranea MMB-1]WCN09280.1 DUF1415 family protein [Marinomonas mediterranea]WCN13362.1 DUF1415 family protein [Marinomonas mediterranea]WCN17430.1 DUF1415 family protein [Marinomonas mediterranea MMB-1]
MQLTDEVVISQTENWVERFIVGLSVCPFAKREVERQSIRSIVIRTKKNDVALQELMNEINWLDQNPETETTLVIFPTLLADFHRYLDFVELAEELMYQQGCEGVYQLATFHPNYCFSGAEPSDVSNYTNRSPYPMLHILREQSVEKAIEHYGDTSTIPDRNIELMEEKGEAELEKLMKTCMELNSPS